MLIRPPDPLPLFLFYSQHAALSRADTHMYVLTMYPVILCIHRPRRRSHRASSRGRRRRGSQRISHEDLAPPSNSLSTIGRFRSVSSHRPPASCPCAPLYSASPRPRRPRSRVSRTRSPTRSGRLSLSSVSPPLFSVPPHLFGTLGSSYNCLSSLVTLRLLPRPSYTSYSSTSAS